MHLKNIEIKGFKSFADKINLQFDRGIAAIVGPNGSGKSNIADGTRWVLGEQSIKALRGSRMEDVIFSGTDSRKALGFAEVSVTLDNSDGFLPIEYSEVMVTRRVYRSGESEYYLNKTGCRLRDINELFMDTGIGKEGYSIIGQGRIDEILSSRAEDRRRVFEEAAGIVKYKTRKEEAERKLIKTEGNLLRLGDIIEELQRQIGPLAEQSRIAKAYRSMHDELKGLEISMFIKNIDRLKGQKKVIIDRSKELQRSIDLKTGLHSRLESDIHILENKTIDIEEELKSAQEKVFKNLNLIESKKGESKVLKQRIQGENESIGLHIRELGRIKQDISTMEDEKRSKAQEALDLQRQLLDRKKMMESFQADLDCIGVQVGEEEEKVEDIKISIIENLNAISDQKSKRNSLKTLNETIHKRKMQLSEEIKDATDQVEKLKGERKALQSSLDILAGDLKGKASLRSTLEKETTGLGIEHAEMERKQKSLRNALDIDKSRLNLLKQMEMEYEGYSRSVKGLVTAQNENRNFSKGVIGPVAELIEVKTGLEKAIEIALGYSLQSIITGTEEDAKRAIEFLKQKNLGRATFLPVSSIKPRYLSKREEGALEMKGIIGPAVTLIECSARVRGVMENLLGRVVVVDTLDNSIKIARAYRYAFKIVTIDGDVINAGGSMTGGSVHSKDTGLLQRKRAMKLCVKSIRDKKNAIGELDKSFQSLCDEEKKVGQRLADTIETQYNLELQQIRLIEMTDSKYKELMEKEAKRIQLGREKLELESDYCETQEEIDKIEKIIRDKEVENQEKQDFIEELQRKSLEKNRDRESMRQQITSHRVEAARLGQKLEDVKEGCQRAASSLLRLRSDVCDREGNIARNRDSILELENTNCLLHQEIKTIDDENEKANSEIIRLGTLKTEYQREMKEKERSNKEISLEISELEKKLHKDEVQLAKVDMELNSLQDRMWEDYEVTHIQALGYESIIENVKEARNRIAELKSKLKDLGNVSFNAIDEYKKVKERFDFLSAQRRDLEEAKEALKGIIEEMLESMEERFKEQFSIINDSFGSIFKELFGGGKAQVLLANGENVLETGIDIIAQPPGKKLQHLSLLSGGEKALTAIALLFAILSVKPSPFCILDEIESALDDANVERFGTFLKKLSANIQFVVITHRKGTMEIANNLYGITMEEKGISKLVSVKLEDMVS